MVLLHDIPATFVATAPVAVLDQGSPEELDVTIQPQVQLTYFAVVGVRQCNKIVRFQLGAGSALACYTLACGSGGDVITVAQKIEHAGFASTAYSLVKGVFTGAAHADVTGVISIPPAGQQAESFLEQRALLLSDAARANLQPQLQIEANDVRASHAATVGHLDDAQLFYCQSRGIDRAAAARLIVQAFLADILRQIPDQAARQAIAAALSGKLDGEARAGDRRSGLLYG